MLKQILFFVILTSVSLHSRGQLKENQFKLLGDSMVFKGPRYINFKNITVSEYIERLRINSIDTLQHARFANLLFQINYAQKNWIQPKDIAYLIQLIDNESAASCVTKTISSILPDEEHATIGGHAMDLIDAYRLRLTYPCKLTSCAINDVDRKKVIKNWWNNNK